MLLNAPGRADSLVEHVRDAFEAGFVDPGDLVLCLVLVHAQRAGLGRSGANAELRGAIRAAPIEWAGVGSGAIISLRVSVAVGRR